MKKLRWILENGVFDPWYHKLTKEITQQGFELIEIPVLMFGRDISIDLNPEIPAIYHGSLNTGLYLQKNYPSVQPGFIGTTENYTIEKCTFQSGLYDYMLNSDCSSCTLGFFIDNMYSFLKKYNDHIFIRPNDGIKSFAGKKISTNIPETIEYFKNDIEYFELDLNLDIWYSSVKDIYAEWRAVVTEDNIIDICQYKYNHSSVREKSAPDKVWEFVDEVKEYYVPDDVFVVDIADTNEGLKIIEYNEFSGAGLYALDLSKIISEVSKLYLE